jgi:ribosome recycling factor
MIDFTKFKKDIEDIKLFLQKEFAGIRTGAASVSILDPITVEAYGSQMPLNQLASISVEGATSLVVTPFDTSIAGDIEKAIANSGTGLAISNSGSSLRLTFPGLTADRRVMLIKLAKEKLEGARVSLRKARDDIRNEIIDQEKAGEISEDEKFRLTDEMEKLTKEANKELDSLYENKEKEINE